MYLKAKLIVPLEKQHKLMEELNRLHGFADGLVPFTVETKFDHLDAAYRIARNFNLEFVVDVKLNKDGSLSIERIVQSV